ASARCCWSCSGAAQMRSTTPGGKAALANMFDNFPIWPEAASSHAFWEDALYVFLVVVCAAMTVLIFAAVAILATKYRRRHGREATPIHGSLLLEITWSVLPMGVFLLMFVGGAVLFFIMRTPPRYAADVH